MTSPKHSPPAASSPSSHHNPLAAAANLKRRRLVENFFRGLCLMAVLVSLGLLAALLYDVAHTGWHRVSWDFLTNFPSRFADKAGIKSALWGSIWVMSLTALFSIPLGVASAVYMEEYVRKGRWATFIDINIANLAGVPSIIYGFLGLAIFVRGMALERSVISGALTLSLLILPMIIIASREAIRSVPPSLRQASFALGASRWQTIWSHVLPAALPGIMTGVILSLARAMGEAAPLIMIGALSYVAFVPKTPLDTFTTLPIQIFNWASRPKREFHELAAGGIIVLLVILFLMNGTAVYIRHRSQRGRR